MLQWFESNEPVQEDKRGVGSKNNKGSEGSLDKEQRSIIKIDSDKFQGEKSYW